MILLRHAASLRTIVFGDRGVFIAQVHLDDFLHVLIQFGQLLLEVARLRPDAAVDAAFLVIGEVHEGRKILSEPDRVQRL